MREPEIKGRHDQWQFLCGTWGKVISDRGTFLERRNGSNSVEAGRFGISAGAGVHLPPVLALGVRCRCKSAPRRPRTPKATTVGAAASRREPPNSFRGGALKSSDKAPPITMRFSAGHEQRRLRREQEPGAPANFQSAGPSRNPANPLEPFL
jgi:hypothetical protein